MSDTTCYVERSEVRRLIMSKAPEGLARKLLAEINNLTISTAADFRDGAPAARTSRWRYEIQDEPEGEFKNAEFAQVFDDKGASVGTLKLHHAFLIVGSINNDELVKIETPPIPPILQREWMAQALFEVDAPDHLEWEDVGIDKRERYLCLADAAIRRNNTCP